MFLYLIPSKGGYAGLGHAGWGCHLSMVRRGSGMVTRMVSLSELKAAIIPLFPDLGFFFKILFEVKYGSRELG